MKCRLTVSLHSWEFLPGCFALKILPSCCVPGPFTIFTDGLFCLSLLLSSRGPTYLNSKDTHMCWGHTLQQRNTKIQQSTFILFYQVCYSSWAKWWCSGDLSFINLKKPLCHIFLSNSAIYPGFAFLPAKVLVRA